MTHSPINDAIRRAADRNVVPTSARERELERPVGDLGGGKGGCCAMPRPQATSNAAMNNRIRAGITLARHAALAGGIRLDDAVDVDDLLGRR